MLRLVVDSVLLSRGLDVDKDTLEPTDAYGHSMAWRLPIFRAMVHSSRLQSLSKKFTTVPATMSHHLIRDRIFEFHGFKSKFL